MKRSLKTYTIKEIKDEMIGKKGTPDRDEYESMAHVTLQVSLALRETLRKITETLSPLRQNPLTVDEVLSEVRVAILSTEQEFEDKIFG